MRPRLFVLAILVLVAASAAAQSSSDPVTGLTTDFRNWLTANGYGGYHFERGDVAGGAYGGRTSAEGDQGILVDMNAASHYEGSFVYTIWSTVDEVIGWGDVVWGQYTSRIPGQNGEVVFGSAPYGHFGCKDLTGYYQWRMVKFHATN